MNIKDYISTIIIFFISFILQITVFDYLEVFNVKPNIILILIVCYALSKGSLTGAIIGLITGIFADLVSGKIFGLFTICNFYTGIIGGLLYKRFFRDNIIVIITTAFVFTVFYDFLFYFMKYFIWTESGFGFAMKEIILREAIYNAIIVIPVRFIIFRIDKWLSQDSNTNNPLYW